MTGLSFIATVSLMLTQVFSTQGQVAGTCMQECSTGEVRRTAVNKLLTTSDCKNYICGKLYLKPLPICFDPLLHAALQKVLNLGLYASHPAHSCADIFEKWSNTPSGYYWLKSANGSAVRVFCDMTLICKGVGGGWMQVAKLDMTNSSHQCPPGTRLRSDLPKRLCGIAQDGPGCTSAIFTVHGIEYRQVCGKIIAYQDASPDAFRSRVNNHSIDNNYVDGISLTHGSNPREHIWTFAAALDEVGTLPFDNCPCTNTNLNASASRPPSFVRNDYFCDTASENR